MSNNTITIDILGAPAQVTAVDGDELTIYIEDTDPAIVNGIAYSVRAYLVINVNGDWQADRGR